MSELKIKTRKQITEETNHNDWVGREDLIEFQNSRWVSLDSLKALLAEQRERLVKLRSKQYNDFVEGQYELVKDLEAKTRGEQKYTAVTL